MENPSRSCSGVETRAYRTAVGPVFGRTASLPRLFAPPRGATCLLVIRCTRLSVDQTRASVPVPKNEDSTGCQWRAESARRGRPRVRRQAVAAHALLKNGAT